MWPQECIILLYRKTRTQIETQNILKEIKESSLFYSGGKLL